MYQTHCVSCGSIDGNTPTPSVGPSVGTTQQKSEGKPSGTAAAAATEADSEGEPSDEEDAQAFRAYTARSTAALFSSSTLPPLPQIQNGTTLSSAFSSKTSSSQKPPSAAGVLAIVLEVKRLYLLLETSRQMIGFALPSSLRSWSRRPLR